MSWRSFPERCLLTIAVARQLWRRFPVVTIAPGAQVQLLQGTSEQQNMRLYGQHVASIALSG